MINTIFLVLLVCTISLNAQWEIINDGDTTLGYINDIDFFNEKIGWIECDFELLLTIDGGNTWLSVHSFKPEGEYSARFGHPPNIKDAAFINDSIGWYIYKDSLYQTKNRGKIWELAFESEIKKIHTLNDSIIIVANKNELKISTDCGNTWIIKELEIAGSLDELFFINEDYGFVVFSKPYEDKIYFYRTIDGGENWNYMDINDFTGYSNCRDISFVDDTVGYALVYTPDYNSWDAVLFATIDSGKTWQKLIEHVSSYSLPSHEEIYIAVNEESQGKILMSTDRGITWNEKYDKIAFIHDLYVDKDNRVFLIEGAIPDWVGSLGEIVVMNDFGFNNDTWETIKIYVSSLTSIEIFDEHNWLIMDSDYGMHWGYSNLFLTNDGGASYEISLSRNAMTNSGSDVAIENYCFIDEKYGYFVKRPFLYKSDNGGRSWNKLSEFCPEYIYFITPVIGWASDDGILYKTTDGALNWEEELNDHRIFTINFIDENNGWAVSTKCSDINCVSILLKNYPNNQWTEIYEFGKDIWPNKMEFIDHEIGLILADKWGDNYSKSIMLITQNSGNSWHEINDLGYYINDFALSDDRTIWVVGQGSEKGVILKSNDFGETWEIESDTFSYPLNAISVKESLVVAVGDGGLIVKTLNNGLTWNDEEREVIVSKFSLSQNYPNPFNPSTTIKYTIPRDEKRKTRKVKLVIYDILGREVAALVNEKQKPGNYQVEFNSHSGKGRILTSGIYFYRITAGEYIETKKMILLK